MKQKRINDASPLTHGQISSQPAEIDLRKAAVVVKKGSAGVVTHNKQNKATFTCLDGSSPSHVKQKQSADNALSYKKLKPV